MLYDQILEAYCEGKNFRVGRFELGKAVTITGQPALEWWSAGMRVFGRPVLRRIDHYLVFVRCEYCGSSGGLDSRECCASCGAEPN